MEIILASASPRRKELLEQIGAKFLVQVTQGEEVITQETPGEVVKELAAKKAEEIYEKERQASELQQDFLVIGADTVVVYKGQILGKPKDEADAARILRMLSGNTHEVYTGVALRIQKAGEEITKNFYEKTEVIMYEIGENEIETYIASREPMDKAGAYGIQGLGAKFIHKIAGDYNNVVGLPVSRIYQELLQLGIDISRYS